MINAIMKWARTPRPDTFQARRLQAIGSGAWFPSTKIIKGCGVNTLPLHHYGYAEDVFSWYDEKMQNILRLPTILIGKLPSGFYQMDDQTGAMGKQLEDGNRVCIFNLQENLTEHDELLFFLHEAAHCLNLLWHNRYFLALHLMLNYRSGVEFTEQEVDYDYCTSQDFNQLSAVDWAQEYALQNYQNDETALTLAMNLLLLKNENKATA